MSLSAICSSKLVLKVHFPELILFFAFYTVYKITNYVRDTGMPTTDTIQKIDMIAKTFFISGLGANKFVVIFFIICSFYYILI